MAAIFDHILISLIATFILYLFWGPAEAMHALNGYSAEFSTLFEHDINSQHEELKKTCIVSLLLLAANTVLLLSKRRATLGMIFTKLQVQGNHGKHPTPLQAIKFFFLSPILLSLHIYTLYLVMAETPMDLYRGANAGILSGGLSAALIIAYTLIFGSVLDARQKLTGLTTSLHPAYAAKLQRKMEKKGTVLPHWFWPSLYAQRTLASFIIAIFLFFSTLVALDLFKQPSFEQALYLPYNVNWGDDNGYFALEGLNAPADVSNFYTYGRNVAYQSFIALEELKKAAHIPYGFSLPPRENFEKNPENAQRLEFKTPSTGEKDFTCFAVLEVKSNTVCASKEEVKQALAENDLLWSRFHKLAGYTDFSIPPQRIGGLFRGQDLFRLSQLKSSDIIFMQQDGHSAQALDEWIHFMQLYRRMTMANNNMVTKAIFMIVHNHHAAMLETLLYNDPELARTRLDDIRKTLNPEGVKMFRGEAMLADDVAFIEPEILYAMGKSTGIRTKLYACIQALEEIARLSARAYFSRPDTRRFCPALQKDSTIDLLIELNLKTTGNPITNSIWGLVYSGTLKGTELISNMHIADAKLRMSLLGAEILHRNIPAEDITAFIQSAPQDLQNPVEEKPFHWDEEGAYLWMENPRNADIPYKFRLKLGARDDRFGE